MTDPGGDGLERELRARVDDDGFAALLESIRPLTTWGPARQLFRLFGPTRMFVDAADEAHDVVADMAGAIRAFAPYGWAPSERVPADLYREAVRVLQSEGIESAEEVLVTGWSDVGARLPFLLQPIAWLGREDPELRDISRARWRMVEKALGHHASGAFEASVPIVLAQVDGIVSDVTENAVSFFSGGGQAKHLVDTSTIAGLDVGLEQLRKLISKNVRHTGVQGTLARHGIFHGRELGYDTQINSTKALVLLGAIAEWADPRATALAERRRVARELKNTGVVGFDPEGRWLDRRGFKDAEAHLEVIAAEQRTHYLLHHIYRPSTAVEFSQGIDLAVTGDGQSYFAFVTTPSGFCIGVAASEGGVLDSRFAAADAPTGGPEADVRWSAPDGDWPVDWE